MKTRSKKAARATKTEAVEDLKIAFLVARARKEIAAGAPLIPKQIVDRIVDEAIAEDLK